VLRKCRKLCASSTIPTGRGVGDAQGDFSGGVAILGCDGDGGVEEDGVLPRWLMSVDVLILMVDAEMGYAEMGYAYACIYALCTMDRKQVMCCDACI
jgi:hypothetical protein